METIRQQTAPRVSGIEFYFQSADIREPGAQLRRAVAVDIQVEGPNLDQSYQDRAAAERSNSYRAWSGGRTHQQAIRIPRCASTWTAKRPAQLGLTEQGVANSMLISFPSSALIAPSYFLNPGEQCELHRARTHSAGAIRLRRQHEEHALEPAGIGAPVAGREHAHRLNPCRSRSYETLANVSRVVPSRCCEVSHYTVQRVIDINANLQAAIWARSWPTFRKKLPAWEKASPRGKLRITVHGQYEVMDSSFRSLLLGLVLAIVLVYLLMSCCFSRGLILLSL